MVIVIDDTTIIYDIGVVILFYGVGESPVSVYARTKRIRTIGTIIIH